MPVSRLFPSTKFFERVVTYRGLSKRRFKNLYFSDRSGKNGLKNKAFYFRVLSLF